MAPVSAGVGDSIQSENAGRRAAAREARGADYGRRRAEIVRAAAEVFRAKGYRGTGVADVARVVGVDRATIYYYVGGKDELLDEIATDVVLANLRVVEDIRDAPGAAPAKLRTLVTQLMASYAANYPFLYVYLQEDLAHVGAHRQEWAQRMRGVNRRYEAAVEAIIASGIAEGTLRPLAEPRILAYGLMGVVSWTHRWFNPDRSPVGADVIGEAYAELLLAGMAVAEESQRTVNARVDGGSRPS